VLGLALFHSLFNVIGVIVFFPFISKLAGFAEARFREVDETFSKYILQNRSSDYGCGNGGVPKRDCPAVRYALMFIDQTIHPARHGKHIHYDDLVRYHAEIFEYNTKLLLT
jgi:phosphate:Na+ symporter